MKVLSNTKLFLRLNYILAFLFIACGAFAAIEHNDLEVRGHLYLKSAKEFRLFDTDSSNYFGLKAPTSLSGNTTFTLPNGDGSEGQALLTNGSGVLSWGDAGTSYPDYFEISDTETPYLWAQALSIYANANLGPGLLNDVFVIGTKDVTTGSYNPGDLLIQTGSNVGNAGGATGSMAGINLFAGSADGTANTGGVFIESGFKISGTGNTGEVYYKSGGHLGTSGATGDFTLGSGQIQNVSNASATGSINIGSGATSGAGASGGANLFSGTSVSGATGSISVYSSNASTTSGSVTLQTGTGATRGTISLKADTVNFGDASEMVLTKSFDSDWYGGNVPGLIFQNAGDFLNTTIVVGTWDVESGDSGANALHFLTGSNNLAASSISTADISLNTGKVLQSDASGDSGSIFYGTGNNAGSGNSGDLQFFSGTASNGGNSGNIAVFTGDSSAGNTGDIDIYTGTASGTRGYIGLDAEEVRLSKTKFNSSTVSLTADNQVITPVRSYINLSSNDATASNRTFVLAKGNSGIILTIVWSGTNAGELVDDSAQSGGGNHRLNGTWTPTQYDTLTLISNGTDWHEITRSAN